MTGLTTSSPRASTAERLLALLVTLLPALDVAALGNYLFFPPRNNGAIS